MSRNKDRVHEIAGNISTLAEKFRAALKKDGGAWPPEGVVRIMIDDKLAPRTSRERHAMSQLLISALRREGDGFVPASAVSFEKEGKTDIMTVRLNPAESAKVRVRLTAL